MDRVFTRDRLLALAAFAIAAAILFVTAPWEGDDWWFDAPSHYMNGVFIHDSILAFPWRDPVGFAERYFTNYPALSIPFYPPMFYLVEAAFFFLFGVHHWVGQLTVSVFAFALAAGTYALCQKRIGPRIALAAGLLLLGMPLVALWSRQIMLEIPAFAFLVWAAHFFTTYLETRRGWPLYLAAILLVAALYTKQTSAFAVLPMAAALLVVIGPKALARSEIWRAAGLGALLLLPLLFITWRFGGFNLEQASSLGNAPPRFSLHNLVWYLRTMPAAAGWVPLALAGIFLAGRVAPGTERDRSPLMVLLMSWLALGYVFFTLVHLKQPRFAIFLYLPIAVFAAAALGSLRRIPMAATASVLIAVAAFAFTIATDRVPEVTGPRQAAEMIAQLSAPGSRVMFHGHRSANFVARLRELSQGGQPIATLRAEKFLVQYQVGREFGVTEHAVTPESIEGILRDYAVQYVVFQENFWSDLRPIQIFRDVLQSDGLEKVAEIPIVGEEEPSRFIIYRNKGPVAERPKSITVSVPIINRVVGAKPE